jgi:hypothetical protein
MTKTVTYVSTSCVRCGGESGYELTGGESVKIYLNQTRNPNFPVFIEGIVTFRSQASATDTSRLYGIQYESDDLEEAAAELSTCDILNLVCVSCCDLLQEHIDAILAADEPIVTLAYRWADELAGIELVATASSGVPDVVISSYVWKDADGNVLAPSGPATQNFTLIPGSDEEGYAGGFYTVLVTDSAGHTNTASVYVSIAAGGLLLVSETPDGDGNLTLETPTGFQFKIPYIPA